MRLAILDIGSNTAHLAIFRFEQGESVPVLVAREREVLALAQAVFPTGSLPADDEERLTATVARLQKTATELGADRLVAGATAALREATNGPEVLARILDATGVVIFPLSGEHEARLVYAGGRAWLGETPRRVLVADLGGGSLEFASGWTGCPDDVISLPLGATRLADRYFAHDPPLGIEHERLEAEVQGQLATVQARFGGGWESGCATSASFRTLAVAARKLGGERKQQRGRAGYRGADGELAPVLTLDMVSVAHDALMAMSQREREDVLDLEPLRARAAPVAALVARAAMETFKIETLVLCPWAIREGMALAVRKDCWPPGNCRDAAQASEFEPSTPGAQGLPGSPPC